MPIFEKAVKAVGRLRNEHVVELRGFNKVAAGVKMVAKVLCLMFENAPPKVRKNTPEEDAMEMYW
jgi:hypothetical protein